VRHVPRGTFSVGAPVRQPSEHCRRIVHEVEEIARSFAGKRLSLSDVYKEASVGPGMIRFAFHVVHGRPPRRFFHDARLQAVRAELGRAPPGLTVTQIAISHGFVELGRFAAQYRAAFGENPSATLRLARMRTAMRSTGAKALRF
jgi:transcriptional regulator GlxA family with amidase domain